MSDTIMTKEQAEEMNRTVKQIREKLEKYDKDSADFKSYQEKAEKDLEKLDELNEKMVATAAANEKKEAELKELTDRIKHLENIGATLGQSRNDSIITEKQIYGFVNACLKKDKFQEYIQDIKNQDVTRDILSSMQQMKYHQVEGAEKMSRFINEYKASTDLLRSDIGELGGFLCPPEFAAILEKNMIEYSPIRRFARVKRTSSKTYKQPVRTGIPVATRPGEARSGGKSTSVYIMEDFNPVRLTNTIPVTIDELLFNTYNLASELIIDNGEAFAVKEGQEFVNGTGVEEGLGFAVDPNVPELDTETNTLTFKDMITITGELKQGYNPMYLFNRRTLAYLRTLEDDTGRFLWAGPFGDAANGTPATINGYRYSAAFIDMDDYDTDNGWPVLFADMMRFYQIVDRSDITIIRDEYSRKVEGIVEYTMNKFCTGKPLIKEAGIRLKKIA